MVLMWLEWYKKVLEIVYDMLIYMLLLYKFGNLMMNLYIFIEEYYYFDIKIK